MKHKYIIQKNTAPISDIRQLISVVIQLSIPAILDEISSIIMQYIDSAMVGSLGAGASASIGLVSTSTWLTGGLCIALASGFSVQTAQLIGASRKTEAKGVLKQSLITALIFGIILALAGISISSHLPAWLGGNKDIQSDASKYFLYTPLHCLLYR